jgi:predicted Zn-dependent protease
MSEAGYDPREMIGVMEVLKAAGASGHSLAIFQTHPNPELRMEQIKAYLAKHPPAPNLSKGRNLQGLVNQSKRTALPQFE